MAESTLTMQYSDLRISAGLELRFGRDPAAWSSTQVDDVARVMAVAMRRAYMPGNVVMPNGTVIQGFVWSWMNPIVTQYLWPTFEATSGQTIAATGTALVAGGTTVFYETMVGKTISFYTNDSNQTLVESRTVASYTSATAITLSSAVTVDATYQWGMVADGDYRLPDNFGGLRGSFASGGNQFLNKILYVNEGQILELRYANPDTTGIPAICSPTPIATTGTTGQRWTLMVYPTPNDLYPVKIPYSYLPDALTSVLVYPAGGMPYSEVFRTAVLAACESVLNDTSGLRESEYQRALANAAAYDIRHRESLVASTQIDRNAPYGWQLGWGLQPWNVQTTYVP